MARAQAVQIGETIFAKKGDALTYLKEMLNRYKLNERVSELDSDFLKEALKNHPEYKEKIGVGIDHFEVRSGDYGTQCFWIIRSDGTAERFSYKVCV